MTKTFIAKVTGFEIRHYSDNGQTKAYCMWQDNKGCPGRTEGDFPMGSHMQALMLRAVNEGVRIEQTTW